MSIVLDANLLVVIMANDARAPAVNSRIQEWINADVALHAPYLLPYEVANAMTRVIKAGALPVEQLADEWSLLDQIPMTYHQLDIHGPEVVRIALQLQRSSAYDAAYIALAEALGAELWTLDGPLARNASSLGYPVHLL